METFLYDPDKSKNKKQYILMVKVLNPVYNYAGACDHMLKIRHTISVNHMKLSNSTESEIVWESLCIKDDKMEVYFSSYFDYDLDTINQTVKLFMFNDFKKKMGSYLQPVDYVYKLSLMSQEQLVI
jgi:hypothetical protein